MTAAQRGASGRQADAAWPALTRRSVGRILESKLRAEVAAHRGRQPGDYAPALPDSPWTDGLRLFGEGPSGSVGCDSLETLWLAASVNEMFHLHELGCEQSLLEVPEFGGWSDIVEAAMRRQAAALTFTTSGSTGPPKRCVHSLVDLAQEVDELAGLFADRTRIVAMAPARHIYGFLFTAMLPDRLGCDVVDGAHPGPGALAQALRAGDLVVSFPDRWRYLERSLARFPAGVAGATSTAPCPRSLIASLMEKQLGSMTEVYGSSETGGVGVRCWPEASYRLLQRWTPDPTPRFGVRSTQGLRLPSGRHVTTMDELTFAPDGTFTVEGRADSVVQVGGVNVWPEAVATRLREHPMVRAASVRAMPADSGGRLKAFIVLRQPYQPAETSADLRRWIDSQLTAPERPKSLTFGQKLPVDPQGKPADW